jgi:hypothetical protein
MRADKLFKSNVQQSVPLVKLAKCPFCEGRFVDVKYNDDSRRFYCKCMTCGAQSGGCVDSEVAVSFWNRKRPAEILEKKFKSN